MNTYKDVLEEPMPFPKKSRGKNAKWIVNVGSQDLVDASSRVHRRCVSRISDEGEVLGRNLLGTSVS